MAQVTNDEDKRRRRYEVSGFDDEGDVHTFGTDDRERAEAMIVVMSEDLLDVKLSDLQGGKLGEAGERPPLVAGRGNEGEAQPPAND